MTAAVQRVRVVLPIDAESTEPLPPLPYTGRLSDPEPKGRHRKTVLCLADPINTITVAELRWREGFYTWPRRRVATWLVVLGYLLALAVLVLALVGCRFDGDDGFRPGEPPKPATTVAVPVPGGGR